MKEKCLFLVLLCIYVPTLSLSVQPDEILADVELENRARMISKELRCLVCQNENIDSSNAELARDLRLLVRERLLLGGSNEDVISHVVQRYGEFVLLKPKFAGESLILWLIGPIVLICSIFCLLLLHWKNKRARLPEDLRLNSEEEQELANYFKKK